MSDTNTYDAFMAAWNDIEAHVRRRAYGEDSAGPSSFRQALYEFKTKHPRQITEQQYERIRILSEFRNALTHGRTIKDQRLAVPTAIAVTEVRSIRDSFLHPPTARTALRSQTPVTVLPNTSIGDAVELMRSHDFSQLPVCAPSGHYLALLTTNTVARWLGSQFQRHGGIAEEASVSDALEHREDTERVLLRPRTLTTTEALRDFVIAAEKGQDLRAIIVTEVGKANEKPLAVIVSDDVARLTEWAR